MRRKKFLLPKETWDFGPQSGWEKEWTGEIATADTLDFKARMSQFRAWLPYILIGAILALVVAGCSASTPEPEGVPEIVTAAPAPT